MSVNGVCTVSEQEWYSLFGEIDKTAPNDSFMAMCAEVGTLVKTQEKKVDELWAKVIKEKDSDALVTLGHMYVQGVDGLSCDCSQAAHLFCRAAEAENSEGIISLYNLFLACTKDDEKSDKERKIIEKLSLIAEKKNPGALFCLGDHYLRTSVLQDLKVEEKARNFLLQAAQLGNSQAMIRLADQVPCDLQEATALCTKAIAAGNTAGYGVMGILYFF